MKVINNCSFAVIAFGWHLEYGHGEDVRIEPGQSAEIAGPYVGELGNGSCHISLLGEDVVCQEAPNDANGFHVSIGNQLSLGSGSTGSRGLTIRHFSEDRQLAEFQIMKKRLSMREPDDPRTKELMSQFKVLEEKIDELSRLNKAIMEKGMQMQEMVNVEDEPDREAIIEVLEELSQLIARYKLVLSGKKPQ